MTITVGTNTYISVVDADIYFRFRLDSDSVWAEGVTKEQKEKALVSAYKDLNYCGTFSLPTETSAITAAIKDAQCEQALFLLAYGSDIDRRKGLQAQGVKSAGIVKESYAENMLEGIAIAPRALKILKDYKIAASSLAIASIDRDEYEDTI